MTMLQKFYVQPGQRVLIECPHSEVCMHMHVAGRLMLARLIVSEQGYKSVQLYHCDEFGVGGNFDRPFSFPIGVGEAGFYEDKGGVYYYLPVPTLPS